MYNPLVRCGVAFVCFVLCVCVSASVEIVKVGHLQFKLAYISKFLSSLVRFLTSISKAYFFGCGVDLLSSYVGLPCSASCKSIVV